MSSLPSEAREEAHAAGASGLRATWDAASIARLIPCCALAPAARGSSARLLRGDSSRRDRGLAAETAREAQIAILAVKPQILEFVLKEIRPALGGMRVISIVVRASATVL